MAREDSARGTWSVAPALADCSQRIDVELTLTPDCGVTLKPWSPLHVHLGAAHHTANVVLLDDEALAPGHSGRVQLVLDAPVHAAPISSASPPASATLTAVYTAAPARKPIATAKYPPCLQGSSMSSHDCAEISAPQPNAMIGATTLRGVTTNQAIGRPDQERGPAKQAPQTSLDGQGNHGAPGAHVFGRTRDARHAGTQ
ncbi:hypothetical protein [Tardiphaga sp.]|uniref:hypothetical protein n=1 Tax=Tardiphaga sp. TaxID=1926292 RepID=UPI00352B7A34